MKNPRKPPALLKFWLAASFCWLLSLACNMPVATRTPRPVSGQQLRQTLQALSTGAPQTPGSEGQTVVPTGEQTPEAQSFPGLSTATSEQASGAAQETAEPEALGSADYNYYAQSGDTLVTLARRFGVEPDQIVSPQSLPAKGLLAPGQPLNIPYSPANYPYQAALLPDSEVVYSPTSVDFDVQAYIASAGGYLASYRESLPTEKLTGAEAILRVAQENSINPRLLLALLEYRSGWVRSQLAPDQDKQHPLGYNAPNVVGLYLEMILATKELNKAYYGWRQANISSLTFADRQSVSLSPALNAGSVALQYLFSRFYGRDAWVENLYGPDGFIALYREMFGDPWARAAHVEPLFPAGLTQDPIELPFVPGEKWSFTGGPHLAWNTGSPDGAIDFSPLTGQPACEVSHAWVVAPAPGVVTRSVANALALDLDGDGYEQTGWVIIFLHLADEGRLAAGARVNLDDPLGRPSCERGNSTGTNVHIVRRYNGEWIDAAGPLPFTLSGWTVHMGDKAYKGSLVKGDQTVTAHSAAPRTSWITR